MQPYVAIDPDAVAALVDEHLPPVVRGIVAAYWEGPTLQSNAIGKGLGSFQITVEWHPNDDGNMMRNVESALLKSLRASAEYESESDRQAVGIVSRLVMLRSPPHSVIPPHHLSHYGPQAPPLSPPDAELILLQCHELLAFSAQNIYLYALHEPYAAAQLVGVNTGHKYSEGNFVHNTAAIAEYIKLRKQTGCVLNESCGCSECADELHHICRREESDECVFLNQCLCGCVHCGDKAECTDAQGLCKNINMLCFSKWTPPPRSS